MNNEREEWDEIRKSDNIFVVSHYRNEHQDSPFKTEIDNLYNDLRSNLLQKMKENPSNFPCQEILCLINSKIFSAEELIEEGLMSENSWNILQNYIKIRQNLPIFNFNNNEEMPPAATDVFFLGLHGTGKTCMLMGLIGAEGNQIRIGKEELTYVLNLKHYGGCYASALKDYIYSGITPWRTPWRTPEYFETPIHGCIYENNLEKQYKKNFFNNCFFCKYKQPKKHYINFFEIGRIPQYLTMCYENETKAFSIPQLCSKNRKILFIIIDPTLDKYEHIYLEDLIDENGVTIGQRLRHKFYKQDDILSKLISSFEHPENQEIMKRVDAIHFIVTKADLFDKDGNRDNIAVDLLRTKYAASVNQLKELCHKYKHINRSTRHSPLVFTFSLGKFYLGNIYEDDPTDSHKLLRAIHLIINDQNKSWRERIQPF